jgi:hypothetical protein
MVVTSDNDLLKVTSSVPKVQLCGSETSAKDLILRENGGNIEIYDNEVGVVSHQFGVSSLVVKNAAGVAIFTVSANGMKSYGSIPFVELSGTENSGADLRIRENAGKIEVYNVGTVAVVATLHGATSFMFFRHLPINPITGAAEAANATWKKIILEAPPGSAITITDVGVIPDDGVAFGQATNYFTLSLVNKGSNGSGTTQIASKAFSSAATNLIKTSLGTISYATPAAGDLLAMEKTVTSNGMICEGCSFYIEYTRAS